MTAREITMDRHDPLSEWHRLQQGQLAPGEAMRAAERTAAAFLESYAATGVYRGEAIALLAEWATAADPIRSDAGLHGLFSCLVERLGDAFDPAACALYNRLFVQVIQHCRRLAAGAALDKQLRRFGLATEDDILSRAASVRAPQRLDREQGRHIKRAFVLSRVTIGADIAVTSVVLAALKRFCPQAQLTLIAAPKAQELFAGDMGISLCPLHYMRGGGLLERLQSWLVVVEIIKQEIANLPAREYLIVDPDSRLTQLGLLPLVPDAAAYAFFESRSYRAGTQLTISELTAQWLHHTFGVEPPLYPYCAPAPTDQAFAHAVVSALRAHRRGPVIGLSLGVGANPRKRLSDAFEHQLLARLLHEGATVILDKGGEPEEGERVDALRLACAARGWGTVELSETAADLSLLPSVQNVQVLTWHGGIGRFAALIGQSDLYIGYDSAGQHIAAALGVPTIDIFTGFSSPRMPWRWAPHGPAAVHLVVIDEGEKENLVRLEAIVDEVIAYIKQIEAP